MILLTTLFFLDFGSHVPPAIISLFLGLQAGPAFVSVIGSMGLAVFGLAIVIALTILMGRVYCSHLCPLGTLQDMFIWTSKRNFKHRKYPYKKPHFLFHYVFTSVLIASALGGSLFVLNLFEPFSSFGRILANLVRPLVVLTNNAAAFILTKQQLYFLYEIPLKGLAVSVVAATIVFLGGLFWLSYYHGRYFCNTLCPVGGVLSIISRASLFRIDIERSKCIDCGLCERVCRARCIDSKTLRIEYAACVGCFDCIDSCPENGMSYRFHWKKAPTPAVDTRKREVLLNGSAAVLWLLGFQHTGGSDKPLFEESRKTPVVPPGACSIEHFSERCTACHLCVSSCPVHVLQPSFLDFGLAGIMQPKMDYSVSYCTFDCTLCGQVCPTGAIQKLLPEEKKSVQIGKTQFVKEDCIVETKKTDCGACSEHCPTKAVRMVPYGKLFLPEVDNQYCVGCGACEHACPTNPRKAIFVQSSAVHGIAKQRKEKQLEKPVSSPQEFPF